MRNTDVQDLVPSTDIKALLAQRQQIEHRIVEASNLLAKASEALTAMQCDDLHDIVGPGYPNQRGADLSRGETDKAMKAVDARLWNRLMNESGLRTFMSAKRRSEWDSKIYDHEVPEFTAAAIVDTFRGIHDSRHALLNEGVTEVFRGLSWDYKTNNPVQFGKRIIIRDFCNHRAGYFFPNTHACDKLDDLLRLFYILDGKPQPDHRRGTWSRIVDHRDDDNELAIDGYIHMRWYKNGNAHMTFLQPSKVAALNRVLATEHPSALPPPRK